MILELLDKIHSSKRGVLLDSMRALLYFVSLFYRLTMAIRNSLYDNFNRWEKSFSLKLFRINIYNSKARVISIGNIVAGGTGKTPLTLLVAKAILKKKRSLAILSRGYKAKIENDAMGPQLISCGAGPIKTAAECGDEPYLMSKNTPGALFYVGKNRVESARMAVKAGANIILLDDGMQYRSLHRDFDIVLLDAQDPFGRDHFLPRGFLREHPKALKRSSLIVLNHIYSKSHFEELKKEISIWSSAPVVGVSPQYIKTVGLDEKQSFSLRGKKVMAFCGIAKPKYFFELLESQGAEIVFKEVLPDHEKASQTFFDKVEIAAKDLEAELMVCTEKDAVKIEDFKSFCIPICFVKIELTVEYGKKEFEKALNYMV
ncbi:MAG: Tetraacyldisaccharide 4'-kinase [Chlamydiae bacterium]|nr:Tetraacyldisaccharide 4'-kinase [Chlamydiota bacterium]